MPNQVARNEKGEPFSKWQPAEKFAYCWGQVQPEGGEPVREYAFAGNRKWRFDFAWPQMKVAVEIDGYGFGHIDYGSLGNAHEKQNRAVAEGWKVLRYTSRQLGARERVEDAAAQVLDVILGSN